MKTLLCLVCTLCFSTIYAQPNCQAFLYYKDTLKYEACIKAEQIAEHYQFSKAYQEILDASLKIDPTFAYAYNRKSVAYLKSGDFITWKKLTDKAVEYNPLEYLGHRGYIRFLCFRDYNGALNDFDKLDSLGFRSDNYGMARALSYNAIGEPEKAIQILETQLNKEDHFIGLYDYLHLGVIYLEQKEYKKAILAFSVQSQENELAENQFYLAMAYKAIKKPSDVLTHLKKAKALYEDGVKMFQTYIDPIHKIYMANIEDELKVVSVQ